MKTIHISIPGIKESFTLMKKFYLWIQESTLRTFTGLLVLSAVIYGANHVHAATSYDVSNEVTMYLNASITTTQTTGITISSPQVNGLNFVFSTTSGGILRIRSGNFREDIYYASATINATTNVITLGTVTRNICPQYPRVYVSCGSGRSWGKGAIVELTQDARLFNLKANIDRSNVLSASGALTFVNSGSLTIPTFANTTLRNQELGANPGGAVRVACSSSDGACYMYIGGTWTTIGTSTTVNASDSVAGKVQIITLANLKTLTATGSTGAQNVLTPRWITATGSIHTDDNSLRKWYIPQLNATGALSASIGGTGRPSPSSGSLLVGQGSGAMKLLTPTAPNQFPIVSADGKNWTLATVTGSTIPAVVFKKQTTYTHTLGTIENMVLSGAYTIPAGTAVAGNSYEILERLTLNANDAKGGLNIRLGAWTGAIMPSQNSTQANVCFVKCSVSFPSVGASAIAQFDCEARYNGVTTRTTSSTGTVVNTVNPLTLGFSFHAGPSGGAYTVSEYESIFSKY